MFREIRSDASGREESSNYQDFLYPHISLHLARASNSHFNWLTFPLSPSGLRYSLEWYTRSGNALAHSPSPGIGGTQAASDSEFVPTTTASKSSVQYSAFTRTPPFPPPSPLVLDELYEGERAGSSTILRSVSVHVLDPGGLCIRSTRVE